jgi:hypothetical protein
MHALPSSLKTLLGRGLLALALLLGQQHAALHWLSHAVEATQAKASKAAPLEHCDECLALAGLGAAATSAAPALPAFDAQHALTPQHPAVSASVQLRLGFHSRAPPVLS